MPGAKFTKRDLNRFRKVYPFIRRTPRYSLYASTPEAIIEIADIAVTAANSVTYDFKETFPADPVVVATAKDTDGTPNIVSAIVTSVNTTQVVIGISATFTGTIGLQAIYIPS